MVNQSINQSSIVMFVFCNLVDFLSLGSLLGCSWGAPWAPQGSLLGGLGDPNYYCHLLLWHPGSLPNFVLNFIFFFDGLGSSLGGLLGSLLGAKMAPNRSTIGPDEFQHATFFKNMIFHKIVCFTILFHIFDPEMEPQRAQDRTHLVPRGFVR